MASFLFRKKKIDGIILLGFISIRVAGFFKLARLAYHNPSPLPGLGTGSVVVVVVIDGIITMFDFGINMLSIIDTHMVLILLS
jgi:hypothetical protein